MLNDVQLDDGQLDLSKYAGLFQCITFVFYPPCGGLHSFTSAVAALW